MEGITHIGPNDAPSDYQVAVLYEERVRTDIALEPQQALACVAQAMAAVDKVLDLRPDSLDALTYKYLLLRHEARFEVDPARQRALLDEAGRLRQRALEARNTQSSSPRRP